MEVVDALASAFDHAGRIVGGIRTEQLDAPTPCSEWDVRALLAHTIGVVTNVGLGVRGEALLANPNATVVEADPGAQFRSAAASTLAAWRALDLSDQVDIGAGPMPGMVVANINLLDTATRSWDLARATGQPADLPADLAATAITAAEAVVSDEIRQFAGIQPAVPIGAAAGPTEQLVAFLGRRP